MKDVVVERKEGGDFGGYVGVGDPEGGGVGVEVGGWEEGGGVRAGEEGG